eukprot:TRINITY_DN9357_c0_g2_i2.p1 TRINITY_DN9357_c0_g2~~TRINITY_DN9357_c0_g2_i2.p1  ORF type:complete len:1502 (+),score=278.51 TRINITY_DN9357_c0_g2_i2:33-4538(+)
MNLGPDDDLAGKSRLRAKTVTAGMSPLLSGRKKPTVNWRGMSPLASPLSIPSDDSEPNDEVANQLVNLANRMGSDLSTDALCNTAWILRYIKGAIPRSTRKIKQLSSRNQSLERSLMEREDSLRVPVETTLTATSHRKDKELALKQEWRDEILNELISHFEEFVARECQPPDTPSAAKYWQIMDLHGGANMEQVVVRQTVCHVTAAALAIASIEQVYINSVLKAHEVRGATLASSSAAGILAIAASCKLFKPRNVLDIDDQFDAWLPLTAVEEIRFTDAENSKRIYVMAAVDEPALQCVTDMTTLLPVAPSLILDLSCLTLTFSSAIPLKVALPWVNLRFLLRAIRTLADRHAVSTNFSEQIPTENEEGPAPGLGVFYVPGDPLGNIAKHETEYTEYRRKGSKWSEAEKRASRRSLGREDGTPLSSPAPSPRSRERSNSKDDRNDAIGDLAPDDVTLAIHDEDALPISSRTPTSRTRKRSSVSPIPFSPTQPVNPSLAPAKGRKTRSLFEPMIAAGFTRETILLRDLWQALTEGIREMCGAVRRASNTNTTLPLLGPFFTAVQALGIRMSASYSEVDNIRRLSYDFNEVFVSMAQKVEYCASKVLTPMAPLATDSLKASRKPEKPVALLEKEREREKEKDKAIVDMTEKVENSEKVIEVQQATITALKREKEKLEKQMKGAAQLLKADKRALLEREQLREAIREVEEMAAAVATMKLEVVQYLSNIENPTPIQKSLGTIAWMLQEYRKFLPTAILEQDRPGDEGADDEEQRASTRPPPEGTIAMVFTDIQSSTALWEAAPEGMTVGLQAHNKIMRDAIKKFQGYEVKTIGDSFMVAFDTAAEACSFALEVQVELTKQDWHPSLLQCSDCATMELDSNVVWHGLRVRIGIHYGKAEMQTNPITGRADYFGPTVNKAARVEAAATGGLVAVTEKVLQEFDAVQFEKLGDPVIIPYGGVMLKGVTGSTDISGLLPRSLGARRSEVGPQEQRGTAPEGNIAILVCDVQNSNALWTSDAKNMALATKLLHDVISQQLTDNHGYEVKRKDQCYTIAFHNAYDACRFALNTQVLLMEQPWPMELLLNADAAEKEQDGVVIWKGLQLRVGIHYDSCETETNPLTKRIEYFGPIMNMSSHVHAESRGGLVFVTQAVLEGLGDEKLALLGDPVVARYGTMELRGITEPVSLSGLFTKSLAGREDDCVPSCALEPKEDTVGGRKASTFNPVTKNLKSGLRSVKATVAYVALNFTVLKAHETFSALSSVVTAVEFAAERTEGLVASVYGKTLIVSWNAGKKCRAHETQAVRFANLLHHRLRGGTLKVNVGVASGDVLYGVVAAERRRFTTAIGGCVDAAKALSDSCRDNGNFCLISDHAVGLSVVSSAAPASSFRPGDKVYVRDGEGKEWLEGIVTEVDQRGVSVRPNSYARSSVWLHIKHVNTPNSSPQSTPNQSAAAAPKSGKKRLASIISFRREKLNDMAGQGAASPTSAAAGTAPASVVSPIQVCLQPW